MYKFTCIIKTPYNRTLPNKKNGDTAAANLGQVYKYCIFSTKMLLLTQYRQMNSAHIQLKRFFFIQTLNSSFCYIYVASYLQVTYPGHKTLTQTVQVPYGPDTFSALTHNVLLQNGDYSSTATQLPQSCTTSDLGIQESDSATLLPSVFTTLTLFLLQRLLMLS